MGEPILKLRPFQRRFLRGALAPGIDTAVLSIPRGNGNTTRVLSTSDALFAAGSESVLTAAILEQAGHVFRFAREALEPTGEYRFLDSHT